MIYLSGGGAVLHTQYNLNGNNTGIPLGLGYQEESTWGWLGGIGAEYAFNNSWSSSFEYNYIAFPSHGLLFPSLQYINDQPIYKHQNMSLAKLGVHYKFDALNQWLRE